jgi:hypothetical protein
MTTSIRRTFLAFVAATALLGSTAALHAVAPDFTPSYRGAPNSVHAVFEWRYGDDQVVGEGDQSVLGSYWEMTLFDAVGVYPLDPTQPAAFDDGLNTTVDLPNFIDDLPVKHMRITMDFDGPVDPGLLQAAISVSAVDSAGTPSWDFVGSDSHDNGLAVYYFDIDIWPNPDSETILIAGNDVASIVPGNLLRIEVDTVSVPEPMTMSLLAAGGVALLRRKRK